MLSRICLLADHQQQIEYLCTFPSCQLNRLLCSKCLKVGIHKHEFLNNSHILNNEEFYQMIIDDEHQQQEQEIGQNQIVINKTGQFKLLLEDLKNQIKNIFKIIQQIEENSNYTHKYSQQELINIKSVGFSQLEEYLLNKLLYRVNQQQKDLDISEQFKYELNIIIKNAEKIKELSWSIDTYILQAADAQQVKSLKSLKFKHYQLDDTIDKLIQTNTISNDLKYIISGGEEEILKIWDYDGCQFIKQIYGSGQIWSSKFTDDSSILYIGDSNGDIYQFDVQNQFCLLQKQTIHITRIMQILCISNYVILTSSYDKTIIKTDLKLNQQLFLIQAHDDPIKGLDYHIDRNIIVSGSWDHSIKIWNGEDGQLIIDKQNAHNNEQEIWQVIFIHNDQLISNSTTDAIIWKINQDSKQLDQSKLINTICSNISLVLNQQYIMLINDLKIRFYSIQGDFIKDISHDVDQFYFFNTVQLQSMDAILIQGENKLQVCKILWD